MIRLILPLAAGILICIHSERVHNIPFAALLGVFIFCSFLLLAGHFFISFKRRWAIGLVLQIFLLMVGYQLAQLMDDSSAEYHFRNIDGNDKVMIARINEPLSKKANTYRTILSCILLLDSGKILNCRGKMLAYFEKETLAVSLKYGDIIALSAQWHEIHGPGMPEAFDYRDYMKHQRVYDQLYLSSDQWIRMSGNAGNPVYAFSISLQESILQTLASQGLTGDELAISSAILAGHREGLDPDLQYRFAGAGAMHILCVSGLHVGVVYLVLSALLGFMGKSKRSRMIKGIMLLSAVWQYALVTGCAPSVLRASTMISFVITARLLDRSPNIYNSLAASALLLLLSDPMIIMSIGFQLSYMAVLGIVTVQPMLYRLLYFKYWLFDKAWAITTVSIAAQAGTFPLAIYYFHQFPNYFILTNLVVIPASSIIIYFGFLLLLAAPFPWLSEILVFLLGKSICLMNEYIRMISSLPYAVYGDLFLSRIESILLYIQLLSMILFLGYLKRRFVWPLLLSLILILISASMRKHRNFRQQTFIVHATGERAYEFIMGPKHYLFLDTADTKLISDVSYQSSNYWIKHGLRQAHNLEIRSLGGDTLLSGQLALYQQFVMFGSKRILFLDSNIQADTPCFTSGEWIIVLSKNAKPDMGELLEAFDIIMLVSDGSAYHWQVREWEKVCDSVGLPYHDVNKEGAFICNLR